MKGRRRRCRDEQEQVNAIVMDIQKKEIPFEEKEKEEK